MEDESLMKKRQKKALGITIIIPMAKGEEVEVEKEDEQNEKDGLAPELKADKDGLMDEVDERDMLRMKRDGVKPKSLRQKMMLSAMEKSPTKDEMES